MTGLIAYVLALFAVDRLIRGRSERPVNEARTVRR